MRSTLAIVAFAAGALAVPYHKEHKRDLVTAWDYVTAYDVVTVTLGQEPASTPEKPKHYGHHHFNAPVAHITPAPAPAPAYNQPAHHPPAYNPPAHNPPAHHPPAYNPPAHHPPAYNPPAHHPPAYNPPAEEQPAKEQPAMEEPAEEEDESSSGSADSAPSYGNAPNDYAGKCLFHHNLHRLNHSVPDVEWDDDLASIAQTIAESCVYAHNTEEGGGGYGQNIAAGVDAVNISAVITELFYNGEEPYYADQYGKDDPDMSIFANIGHFTQMVWASTKWVGCATVECPNGLANTGDGVEPIFTVCNYKSPGNYAGEYAANVFVPKGHPTANWNTGSS